MKSAPPFNLPPAFGSIFFALALALIPTLSCFSQNLLTNGDFENGNTGFTSKYGLWSGPESMAEGHYAVLTNPQLGHPRGASFGDHTSGTGSMLVANGARKAKAFVWSTTVHISPFTTYVFSGWSASWGGAAGYGHDISPSVLRILINGQPCPPDIHVSPTNGLWQHFEIIWKSENAGQAIIEIHDQNTEWHGNDFVLDDLSFSRATPAQVSTGPRARPTPAPNYPKATRQAYSIEAPLQPETKPLPRDALFGSALPPDVYLTHNIEASTNLQDWVQATNVELYFKDVDSTNYNQRFYRFQKR